MSISAIIITRDEEDNIEGCLESLRWCNEIIIIDDNSKDKTVDKARRYTDKIFTRPLNNDFSEQRNYALSKAKYDWILFIDADEKVTSSLRKEIQEKINEQVNEYSGFLVKRKDFIWGMKIKHGEAGDIKLLRMAKRSSGEWQGKIHEVWKINGKISELKNPLFHYPHQTIGEFIKDINVYTTIRAQELFISGTSAYWTSVIFYPLGKFFYNYFFKLGFLDGIAGLVYAVIMSFHSFLVRGKLWLLWQEKK